jgi:hypothetical protein
MDAAGTPGANAERGAGTSPAAAPIPDPIPAPVPARPERKRPAPVTILAGIQVLGALGYGASLLLLLQGGTTTLLGAMLIGGAADDQAAMFAAPPALLFTLIGIFFLAALSSAVLLLLMHRAGWTVTMLLTGFGLLTQIYLYWSGGIVASAWLFINVVTVFYLNQRQVREAFRIGAPAATGGRAVGSS